MELKAVDGRVVRRLRKAVAIFNKNRYHSLAKHARVSLRVVWKDRNGSPKSWFLSFLCSKDNDNIRRRCKGI